MSLRDLFTSLAALASAMTAAKSRVLLYVAEHPQSTLQEIAAHVGIPEGEALSSLCELTRAGIVAHGKGATKHTYAIVPGKDRRETIRDEVLLALEGKPDQPDIIETLRKNLGVQDTSDGERPPMGQAPATATGQAGCTPVT